jgi:hypothetical protein
LSALLLALGFFSRGLEQKTAALELLEPEQFAGELASDADLAAQLDALYFC